MVQPMEHGHEFGDEVQEESPEVILESARPLPPFDELVFEDLTEDQDRIFLETVLNA